jgi:hypothetical protein
MNIKKYNDFLREEKEDDDYSFLDKMLGRNKGVAPPEKGDPRLKFQLPDDFIGGKNVKRPRNPGFKPQFEEGDKLIYHNPKSEHDGKIGKFVKVREDGKFSVVFDDGVKFAGNGNNFESYDQFSKKDFVLTPIDLENEKFGIQPTQNNEPYIGLIKLYPELANMEFEEENGILVYKGDLSKKDLLNELEERDFVVYKSVVE